ncbi:TPA: hypothetical protein ACGQ50_000849 [Enterobacter cloacae]
MDKSLLLKFRQLDVTPTGLYEVTGFHDVDVAVANFIADIVDRARICEPNEFNRAFANFTDRPKSDKVIVGRWDTPQQLLRHIAMAQAGRISEKNDDYRNKDYLPLVNLSRNFMVSIGNTDRAIQSRNKDHTLIYNGMQAKRNVIAVCASQPATLTYDLFVLGPDKESTSLLCNALGLQLVEMVNTGFEAHTRLATSSLKLDCALDSVKGFMLSDLTPEPDTEKYYCATTQLTVITEAVIAYNVMAVNSTVNLFNAQISDKCQK